MKPKARIAFGVRIKRVGNLLAPKNIAISVSLKQFQYPDIVLPTRSSRKRKTVLFVCPHGLGDSPTARGVFASAAEKNPPNANLLIYSAGFTNYSPRELSKILSHFNFVVPTNKDAARAVMKALASAKAKRRPIVIGPGISKSFFEEETFQPVLRIIKEEVEKEEKK